MNERIRELAVEAGYKPLPGFDFANSLEEVFLKKFAELIVRECADLCRERKLYPSAFVADELLEHFGVKNEEA